MALSALILNDYVKQIGLLKGRHLNFVRHSYKSILYTNTTQVLKCQPSEAVSMDKLPSDLQEGKPFLPTAFSAALCLLLS